MTRADIRKWGRAFAQERQDFAIRVLTQTPEENDRDEQEWLAAHPETARQIEEWRAREAVWTQARAEGRIERRYVPPIHPMLQEGLIKDHWGRYEERIVGTDEWREYSPELVFPRAGSRQ